MSKPRMAGDRLKDSTPDEHKDAGWANYNNENYATDNQYGQDLSGIKYKEGISKHFGDDGSIGENDIKRMMDAGYSSDDVYNFSKKKGLNYNQHGQKYMKKQGDYQIGKGKDQWGDIFGIQEAKGKAQAYSNETTNNVDSSTNKPTQTPSPGTPGPGIPNQEMPSNALADGSQRQDITQDNDINTNINGDGNLVTSYQDNSSRLYGGVTKNFTYNGNANGNPYEDSPVSAGTMGGFFYDEDSPGSSAAFVDRYSTMNRDNQKRYKNPGIAQTSIKNAERNEAINFDNLDQRIRDRSKATRARSTTMAGNIFGDMFNFKPQEFKAPAAPEPIKKPSFM